MKKEWATVVHICDISTNSSDSKCSPKQRGQTLENMGLSAYKQWITWQHSRFVTLQIPLTPLIIIGPSIPCKRSPISLPSIRQISPDGSSEGGELLFQVGEPVMWRLASQLSRGWFIDIVHDLGTGVQCHPWPGQPSCQFWFLYEFFVELWANTRQTEFAGLPFSKIWLIFANGIKRPRDLDRSPFHLASFLPIFSLLRPSILNLGSGTGQMDRPTGRRRPQTLNSPSPRWQWHISKAASHCSGILSATH